MIFIIYTLRFATASQEICSLNCQVIKGTFIEEVSLNFKGLKLYVVLSTIFEILLNGEFIYGKPRNIVGTKEYICTAFTNSDKPLAMKNIESEIRIVLQLMKNTNYCSYYGCTI